MPRATAAPDPRQPLRSIRLSDAEWSELGRIAERHDLIVRALPSRAEAIRWLIAGQAERDEESRVEPGPRSR